MIQYWLWSICTVVWRVLPPKVGYRCATFLADIAYLAWPRGRAYARQNMAVILGPDADRKKVDRMARQCLRNYCMYLVDFIRFPKLKPDEIRRKVRFDGWENLARDLDGGTRALFIGMHLGNWDLAAAAVTLRNYPLNAIAESFEPPRLNYLVRQSRVETGLKIIPMEHAARSVLRVLRRNEALALLIDRPTGEDGVTARFFNGNIRVPAGAATLALRTGARVLTGGAARLSDDTFRGFLDEHIEFEPSGDMQRDISELTQRIVASIENMVKQYPDQWYMFRSIFVAEPC